MRSSEAFAIETSEPVVTNDIANEDRFEFPDFMKDHGVAAIVNVPIPSRPETLGSASS